MLQGSVLHNNHGGASVKGGHGDVVGISWKPLMRTNEDPCLVVTCAHQVVVYKVSEHLLAYKYAIWLTGPPLSLAVASRVCDFSRVSTNDRHLPLIQGIRKYFHTIFHVSDACAVDSVFLACCSYCLSLSLPSNDTQ